MMRTPIVLGLMVACASVTRSQDTTRFAGVDDATGAQLSRIVATAQGRGLPVDPILSKVRLALVMHAAPGKIIATAQAMANRLEIARSALAPRPLPADIAAGEQALSYNIPKGVLERVRRARPSEPVVVPLAVLTQLVASGVPAERAGDIVSDLIRRGASATQLADLGNAVDSDVRSGIRATESADVRLRRLNPFLAPPGQGAATAGDITGSAFSPRSKP